MPRVARPPASASPLRVPLRVRRAPTKTPHDVPERRAPQPSFREAEPKRAGLQLTPVADSQHPASRPAMTVRADVGAPYRDHALRRSRSVYETSPTKPTSGETKVIDQIGDRSRPTTDQCRPASAVERRTWHGCNRPPVPHAGLDARLPRRKPSDAEGNSSVVPRTAPVDPTRHWAPPSVVLAKTPAHFGEQDEPATNPSSVPAAATAEWFVSWSCTVAGETSACIDFRHAEGAVR